MYVCVCLLERMSRLAGLGLGACVCLCLIPSKNDQLQSILFRNISTDDNKYTLEPCHVSDTSNS